MNSILHDIYTTQRQLDEEAHHNLQEYVEKTHRHILEMAETHDFPLRYGTRIGGYETIPSIPSTVENPSISKEKESLIEA